MKSEQYLLISRLSFGFSLAALLSALTSGCDSSPPSMGPEQAPSGERAARAQGSPADIQASTLTPRGTAGETQSAEQPTAPAPNSEQPTAKAGAKSDTNSVTADSTAKAAPPREALAKAPSPSADPDGAPEITASSEGLELERLVVTHEVQNREPAVLSELAIGEQPVIAFVKVKNEGQEDKTIVVSFESATGTSKVGFIELTVPPNGHGWRTWGQTRMIRTPGEWVAVVSGKDGRELGRVPFSVKAP